MTIIIQNTIDYAAMLGKTNRIEELRYLITLWDNVTEKNMRVTKEGTKYVKIEDEEEA